MHTVSPLPENIRVGAMLKALRVRAPHTQITCAHALNDFLKTKHIDYYVTNKKIRTWEQNKFLIPEFLVEPFIEFFNAGPTCLWPYYIHREGDLQSAYVIKYEYFETIKEYKATIPDLNISIFDYTRERAVAELRLHAKCVIENRLKRGETLPEPLYTTRIAS